MGSFGKKVTKQVKRSFKDVLKIAGDAANIATLGIGGQLLNPEMPEAPAPTAAPVAAPEATPSAVAITPPDAEKAEGDNEASTEASNRRTRRRGKSALKVTRSSGTGISI